AALSAASLARQVSGSGHTPMQADSTINEPSSSTARANTDINAHSPSGDIEMTGREDQSAPSASPPQGGKGKGKASQSSPDGDKYTDAQRREIWNNMEEAQKYALMHWEYEANAEERCRIAGRSFKLIES
ncbi:unnamed protein product, partial [Tilletia laevis]